MSLAAVSPPTFGAAALGFLVFAGVLLPIAGALFAWTERRSAAPAADTPEEPGKSRVPLYVNALLTHAILLGAALLAADVEGASLFGRARVDLRAIAAAAATLGASLAVGETFWRSRSPSEQAQLWIRRILPRTRRERAFWVLVSAGAAAAEEVAYRGAFVTFAATATGSLTLAVVASAVAFAAVHAPQGLVAIAYVFALALLHQALVLFTGTLAFAIVVHFAYDVLAGLWLAKRHGLVTACGLRPAA